MIGYHENAVKITSMGRAKASAERPPPRTHSTEMKAVAKARRRDSRADDRDRLAALARSPEITSVRGHLRPQCHLHRRDGEPEGSPSSQPIKNYFPSLMAFWATSFACERRAEMFAFLSANTA